MLGEAGRGAGWTSVQGRLVAVSASGTVRISEPGRAGVALRSGEGSTMAALGEEAGRKTTSILSIDGGGIRGVIPALLLAEIEARTGRRIFELFDVVAGTSTGGILALGLTRPAKGGGAEFKAAQLVEMYRRQGPKIFPHEFLGVVRQLFGPKYPERGRREVLTERFGDVRLSEALTEVFITSYDIAGRRPFFFRRADARETPARDFRMSEAALATSAAPTYFPPVRLDGDGEQDLVLVDGGVFANDPSMCGYVDRVNTGPPDLIVSLGTGEPQPRAVNYRRARHWGLIGWGRRLIDVIFAGVTEATEYELGKILPNGLERYQLKLPKKDEAMDNASRANVADLEGLAQKMIKEREADLDALCQKLLGRLSAAPNRP